MYDVIVVGLGAMGSAAAFHLASRGVSVLGLEQFDIPHSRGSSHGHSRMIRQCYFEHPDYVPLLKRAYELWGELEERSEQKLLHITGGVYIGKPDSSLVAGSLKAAKLHGLPHELILHAELCERYPQFMVPEDHVALIEPAAGLLIPERVVASHTRLALEAGGTLHAHEPVLSWNADSREVSVTTAKATYKAKHLVIAAGTWATRLVRDLGVTIRPTRQVLGWVWPKKPDLFKLGVLPVWALQNADGTEHYGFPLMPEAPGFKIAHHTPGEPTDPDRNDWSARPEDEATFRPVLTRHIPDADGPLLGMRICMYENSPDSHFIIDQHPTLPNVTVACGFSGHGFKFSSVAGEILADLATVGKTRHQIGFLSLERFGSVG